MTHPPGTIVVPASDHLRYPEFFIDYSQLDVPAGTEASIVRSASIVENLNMSLSQLPENHGWVWLLADDHVFPRNLLRQLLDNDADVIVPLCVKRSPPFQLVIMREESTFHDERLGRDYPGYLPYQLHEVPDEPFEVVAAGSAGMLIRRHVIDSLNYPYFESSDGVYLNEDLQFCRKLREHGYKIMCDPHAYLGHIGQMHIWPEWKDGLLMVKLDCGGPDGMNEVFIGEKPRDAVPA